jgi:hypothetical protein
MPVRSSSPHLNCKAKKPVELQLHSLKLEEGKSYGQEEHSYYYSYYYRRPGRNHIDATISLLPQIPERNGNDFSLSLNSFQMLPA